MLRSVYGPADDDDWSLPDGVQPQDNYLQGGPVAARFLLWLEQHTTLNIVDQLNHALQKGQTFSAIFHRLTHHTVDQLWSQYQHHPNIIAYSRATLQNHYQQKATLSDLFFQPASLTAKIVCSCTSFQDSL